MLLTQQNLRTLLDENEPSFWQTYSVVIVCGGLPNELKQLSDILWGLDIPLFAIDSLGFFGSVYISVKEHTVIESHPTSLVDLRLDDPWPELIEFVDSYNLDTLDEVDLAHVPYVVLLLKYKEEWKKLHDYSIPRTFKEKNQFKEFINSKRSGTDQENYDEAVASSWRLFQDSTVCDKLFIPFQLLTHLS